MVSSEIKIICESVGFQAISMPIRPAFILSILLGELVLNRVDFMSYPSTRLVSPSVSDTLVF